MDRIKLFKFIQKIIENSTVEKAVFTLRQLQTIMLNNNVSKDLLCLIDDIIYSLPELKHQFDLQQTLQLDETALYIAKERRNARLKREAEMNNYRGCR